MLPISRTDGGILSCYGWLPRLNHNALILIISVIRGNVAGQAEIKTRYYNGHQPCRRDRLAAPQSNLSHKIGAKIPFTSVKIKKFASFYDFLTLS